MLNESSFVPKNETPKKNDKHNISEQFGGKVRDLTQEEIERATNEVGGSRFWVIVMKDGSIKYENVDWDANEKCVKEDMVAIGFLPDHSI